MTNFKKFFIIGAAVTAIFATTITAFAASNYNSPADIVSSLTGKEVENIIDEKFTEGKTYGEIADEEGKLDEFRDEMLKFKKEYLAGLVESGELTQEEADEIISAIEANQEFCTGYGYSRQGQGLGFGRMGNGNRNGGRGLGCGRGSDIY